MAGADADNDRITPIAVTVRRAEGQVVITWPDGRVVAFDAVTLRRHCPCAACRTQHEKSSPTGELFPVLKKDPGAGPPRLVGANLVGNYAIQLIWADGHDTGIYDYRYLRSLESPAGGAGQ